VKTVQLVPANWTRVTADQIIDDRPVVLFGWHIYSAQTGGTAELRDGQNAKAPVVATLDCGDGLDNGEWDSRGTLLTHGLFVDVGSNISEVVVYWLPYVEPVPASAGAREVSPGIE